MRRSSDYFSKGSVSTYYLSVLMYCSGFLTILMLNDQARIRTVMNMKKNDRYFLQEAAVMSDIQCRLKNGKLEEGKSETNGYLYQLDIQNDRIYAVIFSENPETLLISYDPEKRVFLQMEKTRSAGNY